ESVVAEQQNDPLDDLLEDPRESNDLMAILGYLATKKPEESIALSGAHPVQIHEIHSTIQAAVETAAHEAEEEAKDQTYVMTPISRLDEAITKVQRASETLPKARSLPEWKEADFQEKVDFLKQLLTKLGTTVK